MPRGPRQWLHTVHTCGQVLLTPLHCTLANWCSLTLLQPPHEWSGTSLCCTVWGQLLPIPAATLCEQAGSSSAPCADGWLAIPPSINTVHIGRHSLLGCTTHVGVSTPIQIPVSPEAPRFPCGSVLYRSSRLLAHPALQAVLHLPLPELDQTVGGRGSPKPWLLLQSEQGAIAARWEPGGCMLTPCRPAGHLLDSLDLEHITQESECHTSII